MTWTLTGAGLRSEIFRFRDDPMHNQQLWGEVAGAVFVAPFAVELREHAHVLAVDSHRKADGRPIPLVVVGDHGGGRVVFLNNSQFWRSRGKSDMDIHDRFWRQLTAYAAESPVIHE